MMNDNAKTSKSEANQNTNALEQQFQAGLQQTQKLLAGTIVTTKRQGVEITLTAEPKILNVSLPSGADSKTLGPMLRDCLNDAFVESMNAVYENTAKMITTNSP